jgi:hypothetical protein
MKAGMTTRRNFLRASLLVYALVAYPGRAICAGRRDDPTRLPEQAQGIVTQIIDSASLRLDDGGLLFLAGLDPLALHFNGHADPGLLGELQSLLANQPISLRADHAIVDRYDRLTGQGVDSNGQWLQAEILRRGLGRVLPGPDARFGLDRLISIEDQARRANLGLWARPQRQVLSPDNAHRLLGQFGLIEGRPTHVGRARSGYYIDFDAGPKRHLFSVKIGALQFTGRKSGRVDPFALVGQRLRVRGLVEDRGHPFMLVTERDQLEILDD